MNNQHNFSQPPAPQQAAQYAPLTMNNLQRHNSFTVGSSSNPAPPNNSFQPEQAPISNNQPFQFQAPPTQPPQQHQVPQRTLNRHQSFAFGSNPQDFGLGPTPVFSFPSSQNLNFSFNIPNQPMQGKVQQPMTNNGYPVPPNTPIGRQAQFPPQIQQVPSIEKKLSFSLPLSLPSPAPTPTSHSSFYSNNSHSGSSHHLGEQSPSPSLMNGMQRFAFSASQSFDPIGTTQSSGGIAAIGEPSPFGNHVKKHSFDDDFGPLVEGGDDIDDDDDDDEGVRRKKGESNDFEDEEEAELREIMMYQKQALEIISKCNPKPIISMDLDYTIWPLYCFEHTLPPYRRSVGRDTNSPKEAADIKDQIYCICRKTNTLRTIALYPQVKSVIEFCADNNIVLTICSRSPNVGVVEQILTQFGIWDWFLFPQVYNARKSYHFRNLSDATGLQMKDFLFFDDEISNINVVSKLGVYCCHVDKEDGLNWETFLKGITMFYAKQRASNSLKRWLSTTKTPTANSSTNLAGFAKVGDTSSGSRSQDDSNSNSGNNSNKERVVGNDVPIDLTTSQSQDDDEDNAMLYSHDHDDEQEKKQQQSTSPLLPLHHHHLHLQKHHGTFDQDITHIDDEYDDNENQYEDDEDGVRPSPKRRASFHKMLSQRSFSEIQLRTVDSEDSHESSAAITGEIKKIQLNNNNTHSSSIEA